MFNLLFQFEPFYTSVDVTTSAKKIFNNAKKIPEKKNSSFTTNCWEIWKFKLLAYDVEHVSQIFSKCTIERLFFKVLKRTVLQKCINQKSRSTFDLGLALIELWTTSPRAFSLTIKYNYLALGTLVFRVILISKM